MLSVEALFSPLLLGSLLSSGSLFTDFYFGRTFQLTNHQCSVLRSNRDGPEMPQMLLITDVGLQTHNFPKLENSIHASIAELTALYFRSCPSKYNRFCSWNLDGAKDGINTDTSRFSIKLSFIHSPLVDVYDKNLSIFSVLLV